MNEVVYLVTRPMDIPVRPSHNHQSMEKDLEREVRSLTTNALKDILILLVMELG